MRVLAALSGGVDSSVAAALLHEDGHEVVAVTMKLWGGESDTGCCSVSEVEDARRAAAQLNLDHHVFNFGEEFEKHVVAPYVADHAAGRTPNPCVECNRHLKFDVLLRRAELLGYEAVATGHHARIVTLLDGSRRIARGADTAKDQSYVLYTLTAKELDSVMFPIGEMTKEQVRSHAASLHLRTAAKPDSQDVCFITRASGRAAFLEQRIELHPGRIQDEDGETLGTVSAVEVVTLGQRRGLHLAGGAAARYVVDVDLPTATVTVGGPEGLLCDELELENLVWAADAVEGVMNLQCAAHGAALPATVTLDPAEDGPATVRVQWHEPHRRIATGQSVVMYAELETTAGLEQVVVGGGLVR